jgi:hypothetical protein
MGFGVFSSFQLTIAEVLGPGANYLINTYPAYPCSSAFKKLREAKLKMTAVAVFNAPAV